MRIRVTRTDLIHDGSGWSENGASRLVREIEVPDSAASTSDRTVNRMILNVVGCSNSGFRRDEWCQSDFGPWRNGCTGVYADIVISKFSCPLSRIKQLEDALKQVTEERNSLEVSLVEAEERLARAERLLNTP